MVAEHGRRNARPLEQSFGDGEKYCANESTRKTAGTNIHVFSTMIIVVLIPLEGCGELTSFGMRLKTLRLRRAALLFLLSADADGTALDTLECTADS